MNPIHLSLNCSYQLLAIRISYVYYSFFRSESPSQVFLILVQWLLSMASVCGGISYMPPVTLAHDNMCKLDRLCVARKPLPLSTPYDKIWLNVHKIIDVFRNHTNPQCRVRYNPEKFQTENPKFNTQAGEQTFVWAGRFKHILCSMNKTHHFFFT